LKPQLLKRNRKDYLESISFQHVQASKFLNLWHYHEELELVYIVQGSGNYFIGDAIERFGPGTLVLLGSSLPHNWINDQKYFLPDSKLVAESLAVHFLPEFLKVNLREVPEFQPIGQLMEKAKVGLWFGPETAHSACCLLEKMKEADALERLLCFFRILRLLAEAEDVRLLSSPGYLAMFRETNDRLGRVHEYLMNNFTRDISLEKVAEIALMNKSAFCRYFKKATKKHFSQYLNEIRIGFACRLLQENDESAISEIAFESGYNTISNFNRQFKLITGHSPSAYLRLRES
jgi:AraC-like DNA-binding protein